MTQPRYLLDTNIFIYIRQHKPESVLRRFRELPSGAVAMSAITYGELLYGARKSKDPDASLLRLSELFNHIPALDLPRSAGETYGAVRARLEQKGQLIGNNDLWIAAHSIALDLILVTNNEKEFRRIPGLKVENWI